MTVGLPEEEDLETVVQHLKQQIQDITRPSSVMKLGKAHGPVPELESHSTIGKLKRGGKGPGPQLRAKSNVASSSQADLG